MSSGKIKLAAIVVSVAVASLWVTSLTLAAPQRAHRDGSATARAALASPHLRHASWSAPVNMDPAAFLANSVACQPDANNPAQPFCLTVGGGSYRILNGKTWSAPADLSGASGLTGVSCATAVFCAAVDNAGHAFNYLGGRWTPAQTIDSQGGLDSISCPNNEFFCMAIDTQGNAIAFDNRVWGSPQKIDGGHGELVSVSCSSSRLCIAVDSAGYAVEYQGKWGSPKRIDSKGGVTAVSCEPGVSNCVATDDSGHVIAFNGGKWDSPQSVDPDGLGLYGIGCTISPAKKLLCAATDGKGEPVEQLKGKWYIRPVHTYGGLNSVSCVPNALFCIAVGGGGGALKFDNYSWTPITVGQGVSWVTCVSKSFCAAVDYGGHVVFDRGGNWGAPALIDRGGSLTSISCSSTQFCAAVDKRGRAVLLHGTKWAPPKTIDSGGGGLNSVSCAPRTIFCVAVDTNNRALVFKKGRWSKPNKIDKGGGVPNFGLNSVSCPTAKFCAAVNQHDGMEFNGRKWTKPHVVDPLGGFLAAVSCSSSHFCMEVDFEGDDHTYNNGTWSPPRGPNVGGEFNSISCLSATFCIGVGLHSELRYLGSLGHKGGKGEGSWTKPQKIDRGGVFSAVSCASTSYCVAVDLNARAFTYR
jgi:hypothetical protein